MNKLTPFFAFTATATAFTAVCMSSACAQTSQDPNASSSPYYYGASLGLTHLSNVYQTGQGNPSNSDWVATEMLLAGLDQHYGRQRFYLNASVQENQYQHNGSLNNSGYNINGGLDWAAMDKLSGSINASATRNLAPFNPGYLPNSTVKNIEDLDQINASVHYGLAGPLSLEGRAGYLSDNYSAALYQPYIYHQTYESLGVNYRISGALLVGMDARHTNIDYPNYVDAITGKASGDRVNRNDFDLLAEWTATGASFINGRLSVGRAVHSDATASNFSGVTGTVAWRWQPTSKLQATTTLTRDTGLNTGFNGIGVPPAELNSVSTSASINSIYALTGKISLTGLIAVTRRELANNNAGIVSGAASDTTYTLRVGEKWAIDRTFSLICQIEYDQRVGQATIYSTPFTSNTIGCTGQALFH
ncbi:MAG: hypothetical protein JOY60_00100 [Burkholderiaceae bacterium]|nr:hypothetical protein [Roseateles sp.]MBV8468249.1 hypothetical protein [Burkholderiaceae bacterium]